MRYYARDDAWYHSDVFDLGHGFSGLVRLDDVVAGLAHSDRLVNAQASDLALEAAAAAA